MSGAAVNFMIDIYAYSLTPYDFGSMMQYEPFVSNK